MQSRRSRLYATDFARERQVIWVPSHVKLVQHTSTPSQRRTYMEIVLVVRSPFMQPVSGVRLKGKEE